MSLITCDMRFGRTDEQKRKLADGLMRAVGEVTGEDRSQMFLVIREGVGINFVEQGEHLPDYEADAGEHAALIGRLT